MTRPLISTIRSFMRLVIKLCLIVLLFSSSVYAGSDRMVSDFIRDPAKAYTKYSQMDNFFVDGRVSGMGSTIWGGTYLKLENDKITCYIDKYPKRTIKRGSAVRVYGRLIGWNELMESIVVENGVIK